MHRGTRTDFQGSAGSFGQYPVDTSSALGKKNTKDTGSNRDEEEYNDNEHPKTEKLKKRSSIDAEVIKSIQAQVASLTQKDELKKVGMLRPYPLEWDSVLYPPKFKLPTCTRMPARAHRISISITFGHKSVT